METIKLLTPGKPVPIQIGTEVRLKVQPRLTDGSIFNVEALQDIVIKVAGAKTVYEHTIEDGFISLILPATEVEGVYDVFMYATIDDRPVCCAWNDLYSRVRYSNCINYDEYRCDFLVIGSTDEELEAMKRAAEAKKQDYIEAHAEAVAARDTYIRKAESLDGVAKETTSQTILAKLDAIHIDLTPVLQAITAAKESVLLGLTEVKSYLTTKVVEATTTIGQWFTSGKQEILAKIDAIPEPDLSSVAKEATLQGVSDKVGTFTDPTETVAHKLENLTFDKTDLAKEATTAKQGSNPNISLTSLDGKLDTMITSPVAPATDEEVQEVIDEVLND